MGVERVQCTSAYPPETIPNRLSECVKVLLDSKKNPENGRSA